MYRSDLILKQKDFLYKVVTDRTGIFKKDTILSGTAVLDRVINGLEVKINDEDNKKIFILAEE